MRPFAHRSVEAIDALDPREAAPARNRVRLLAIGIFAVLLLLAGRAVQLAFSGDPLAEPRRNVAVAATPRADIVDRNGELLATTVRAYVLAAEPRNVWNAAETADALRNVFPGLDRETVIRRLSDTSRDMVWLRRGLTPNQRDEVQALGLGGIVFQDENRRVYPQGQLAAHTIGFTDVDLHPLSGVERGMDEQVRTAGAEGRSVRLSLDVRMQYALEEELDLAARRVGATGAAAIILDGRTGETYALASWPRFDPNQAGSANEAQRLDRVAGGVYELGSTIKPFTVAMALQEQVTTSGEVFDLNRPLNVGGRPITDEHPIEGAATLWSILAQSSNLGAAQLALRVGGARQRDYLDRLGLTRAARLELSRNGEPIAPNLTARRDIAGRGFGYALASSPVALAGAYTVFTNQGARVEPTLIARAPDAPVERTPVFSTDVTRQMLIYLRAVVTEGTGRAADVPGLLVAGKTGTAETRDATGAYTSDRNFSSFAGVFPANDPRYVIVLALDGAGADQAGGVVAAPAVARTLRRIAPMLGLRVEPQAQPR
ncbi:peptidoglycan D,D-transpeptidase FtsI family protein [Vitreimonas flagellata]|uniref:peptidoglycan D,D-transpeptidase FtsI family protein n=1 Tax=Vitreimonas flagellata TaxID=2560861 RepID=UPI0010750CD2|nr:penicillin-binding protein 2 [Vitreimonas flagellata]